MKIDDLKNSKLLITGGTGSFGRAVLRRYLATDIPEIRIFSRDEEKQDLLRKEINDPRVRFFIGDVRDRASIDAAVFGVDYVFHAAALKQVPSCEFFPMEAIKTNVIGASNIVESCFTARVKKLLMLSTDKAVYPVNAMGMTKALMEKVAIAKARSSDESSCVCCLTRYGNVMGSRGSVIPLFIKQLQSNKALTVTDAKMTRFLMSLDDAVDLVEFAFENAKSGDIIVQKAPAATLQTLAEALSEIFKCSLRINEIGIRHGEKLYETLVSKEEMHISEKFENYYRIPVDNRDLNYEKYTSDGDVQLRDVREYTSSDKEVLQDLETVKELLMSQPFVQQALVGQK
jgi:UDP-N-acetylglucosamine 4,6-dehydratase/5-epimerase